ncbi:MAG: transporter [Smithellaceae bacterium]|jgi:hypothetical protein
MKANFSFIHIFNKSFTDEYWRTCSYRPKSYRMRIIVSTIFLIVGLVIVLGFISTWAPKVVLAGPPFVTDDPEPVEYQHWEVYLAAQYRHDRDQDSSTLPHLEINYGLMPNVQIHLIAPLLYVKPEGASSQYGYGDTELGVKYRFIQETDYIPQVGIFPLVELPTGDSEKGLGNGRTQYFLPLWLQKSWGPWTTYGGGGYWINPGGGNKDWWQFGWLIQREINKTLTLGTELYYKTASTSDSNNAAGYTVGAVINITENHHVLLSVGQDINGPNYLSLYIGYQLTFGPQKKD